ncbi:MAG: hypothetical protein Q9170_006930, partial [Blastenia crenularia]
MAKLLQYSLCYRPVRRRTRRWFPRRQDWLAMVQRPQAPILLLPLTISTRTFLIQCPMIGLVASLIAWKLPTTTPNPPSSPTKSSAKKSSRIDISGSILLFCTIASLLLVLDLGGKKLSLDSPLLIGLICATISLAIFFVLVEGYWAREPVFPLRLAVNRDVATAYGTAALQLAAEFGVSIQPSSTNENNQPLISRKQVTSTVPLYFQVTQNAKTSIAGARLLPGLVAYAVGGISAGLLISKTGRYKLLNLFGPLISAAGFLLLFLFWRGHTDNLSALLIIPGDFGSGISQSTAFIALSAAVEKADTAVAMTGYSVCQQLGVTVGMSTTAAILQGRLRKLLDAQLGGGKGTRKVVERVI